MKNSAFIIVFFAIGIGANSAFCQGWSEQKTESLPDNSFAVIEKTKAGDRIRHSPYRDSEGNIDYEQLIYALGIFEQEEWIDFKNKEVAKNILETYYNNFIAETREKGLQKPVNINKAKLTELVALPRIGPVLAVKIVRYREENDGFKTIEDIKKVKGIGQGTFNGLRFYICTE